MKPVAFDYIRASRVSETVEVLAEYGSDAVVLAGGMSLGPMLNMRLVRPSVVIDITRDSDLQQVKSEGEALRIGATARQADVLADATVAKHVPLLALALPHVGHYQTRSRGTVGGSLAHADPSSEIPLCLVTLGGKVELTSRRATRVVAAQDFFAGILTTARRPDEMITASIWPKQRPSSGYAFAEFAQRHGDFAIAAAACEAELDDGGVVRSVRLGLGGVEDRPILADTAGGLGEVANDELARSIAATVSAAVNPLEDMSASADYRRALAETLTGQVLLEAFGNARARAVP